MSKFKSGILITFEGTEGAGKSTLIQLIQKSLHKSQIPAIVTREPGGSPLGEKIRTLLLNTEMDSHTELLLYEAARASHLSEIILPALKSGKVVLCDRFTDSTLAYQAYARGLPWNGVQNLNQIATQGLQPDLTLFLDIPPEVGLARVKNPNRFEAEGVKFQQKVRRGFLKARRQDPKRWLTLNSVKQTPQGLAEAALHEIFRRFSKRFPKKRETSS